MRARLFVAAHGAGLSNMMFMLPNATVLEILPNRFYNRCYRSLAFVCDLQYHLSVGEGDKASMLSPNMKDVRENLFDIRRRFDVEDGGTIANIELDGSN